MLKVYVYAKCSTCRKALQFLDAHEVAYKALAIRETPPTKKELKAMLQLKNGEIRKLFNTSGLDYKALNLKEKLPSMSEKEAFDLLASNGNLVKRPFVLGEDVGTVGFRVEEWEELFG